MPRRPVVSIAVLAAAALAAGGCGSGSSDDGLADPDLRLVTPPEYAGADPIATPAPGIIERAMDAADARRLRPVLAGWARAVREGRLKDATRYFALPAIVYQPSTGATEVRSRAVAERFNGSLTCAAELVGTRADGRYIVGTFRLLRAPGRPCTAPGELARVGFVFGDRERPRRFTEWWRVPDTPGAPAGPERRPAVPIAREDTFG